MNNLFKFLIIISASSFAQVGINTTTPNAQLEIKSSNQVTPANTDGILIPKVNAFPTTNPTALQDGMMVYVTATIGVNLKGFYYWDNATTTWKQVAGNANANWTLDGNNNGVIKKIGTIDNFDLPIITNNVERIRLSNSGNLGIGTTTPNAPLQFKNDVANRKIVLYEDANSNNQFYGFGINASMLRYQTAITSADHAFFAGTSATDSSELMRIKGNGNVGIGTTTPVEKLEVNGKTKTSTLQVTTGAAANRVLTSDASGNATWITPTLVTEIDPKITSSATNAIPKWNGTALVDGIIQDDATNIGIGTAPTTNIKLNVAGNTNVNSGYFYGGLNSPMNQELIRALPIPPINTTVDIGNFSVTHGAHNFRITATASILDGSQSKSYVVSASYNQTNGSWQVLKPSASSEGFLGNDFEIDININNNVASLRLRKSAIGSLNAVGNVQIRIENTGSTTDVFTSTTATTSNAVPIDSFNNVKSPDTWLVAGNTNGSQKAIGTNDNFDFPIKTNNFERFRIKSNGNIGIGTSSPNGQLQFANNILNRKIVLFEAGDNDHQFFGFGINNNILRYQVNADVDNHVFYSSLGSTNSKELMRITGFGKVGIGGIPDESAQLDINSTTGGVLLPRMTTVQRNQIIDPKVGLLIYNTTENKFQGYALNNGYGVDQSQTVSNFILNGNNIRQFFTAGVTGSINAIQIILPGIISGTGTFTMNVGAPFTFNIVSGLNTINLPNPYPVVSGQLYSFTIVFPFSLNYNIAGGYSYGSGPYSQGNLYVDGIFNRNSDIFFKTIQSGTFYGWEDLNFSRGVNNATDNIIPKWMGSNLVDGSITDQGNKIGIGTTNPNVKLDVDGNFALRPINSGTSGGNATIDISKSYVKYGGTGDLNNWIPNGEQEGQILIVEFTNTCYVKEDVGNIRIWGQFNAYNGCIMQLIWNGIDWLEISRSFN